MALAELAIKKAHLAKYFMSCAASVPIATLLRRSPSESLMKSGLPLILKTMMQEPEDETERQEDFICQFHDMGIIGGAIKAMVVCSKVCTACLPTEQSEFSHSLFSRKAQSSYSSSYNKTPTFLHGSCHALYGRICIVRYSTGKSEQYFVIVNSL